MGLNLKRFIKCEFLCYLESVLLSITRMQTEQNHKVFFFWKEEMMLSESGSCKRSWDGRVSGDPRQKDLSHTAQNKLKLTRERGDTQSLVEDMSHGRHHPSSPNSIFLITIYLYT